MVSFGVGEGATKLIQLPSDDEMYPGECFAITITEGKQKNKKGSISASHFV